MGRKDIFLITGSFRVALRDDSFPPLSSPSHYCLTPFCLWVSLLQLFNHNVNSGFVPKREKIILYDAEIL